jgi:hypothetical protein
MGHVRMGILPQTQAWLEVVKALRQDADVAEIASKALAAAESAFTNASLDAGIGWVTYLLAKLPFAAGDADYISRLHDLGLPVEDAPSVAGLIGAFSDAVDEHLWQAGGRTDYGEMAQLAAAETLASALNDRSKSLWGTSPTDVERGLATFQKEREFGSLSRDYFSRLTRRFLSFFLSRELSNHIGGDRRFANLSEHSQFNDALRLHCDEASRIVETYSRDWFSKHNWQESLTPASAQGFSGLALEKMHSQLKKTAVQ